MEPQQGPHISDLPVDALLEVFRRIPAADLTMAVSGVCQAWRDHAMDPAAWQGRRVLVSPSKRCPLAAAERRVLQRAPALRALAVVVRRAQDLPEPLSQLLPTCAQLRELHLQLPCLFADMAADVARHWPRLQALRVDACTIQEDGLERLGQLRHLRALRLASLRPGVWGPLRRAVAAGLPALRTLDVDALCGADTSDAVAVVLQAGDRLAHLRLRALVPADTALLAAVGQCARLRTLYVEDCASMSDEGLLRLAGLRLEALALRHARGVTAPGLARFLRLADLSLLRRLDLSGCPALTDRAALQLVRCASPPNLVAEDCPNVSAHLLRSLHGTQPSTSAAGSPSEVSAPCTVDATSVVHPMSATRAIVV